MDQPTSQSRTAVRRWAALKARTAISALTATFSAPTFSGSAAAATCYDLVAACAATLALEPRKTIIHSAYFETESFHLQLFEGDRIDPDDFATGLGRSLAAYITFAKESLRIVIPPGFLDCFTQVLERHAVPYLSVDPDVTWNILVRHCWSLYDATASGQQPHHIEAVAEAIHAEISRISSPQNDQTRIDHDAISMRNAFTDWGMIGPLDILGPEEGTVGYTEFDERPRFHRLADRHDAMIANGIPDREEYRRVHAELLHLTQDDYRVDPRRLYGDGPYPWDEAAAE